MGPRTALGGGKLAPRSSHEQHLVHIQHCHRNPGKKLLSLFLSSLLLWLSLSFFVVSGLLYCTLFLLLLRLLFLLVLWFLLLWLSSS